MFGLFKKKSPLDKLGDEYRNLMEASHRLSHIDRAAADKKVAEAEKVAEKMDALRTAEK
jgi:hypothetical protein